MDWIIAIICIVIVFIFWRIFLLLALIIGVGLGALFLYEEVNSNRNESKRVQAEKEIQEKIAQANAMTRARIANAETSSKNVEREWEIWAQTDPASGLNVPRNASVLSDNGLCRLRVEQRIDASRLTGIYCPGIKLSTYSEIDVKFDNRTTSDKMKIEKFSDINDVYISANQSTYNRLLQYDEFLQRMTVAKKVALLLSVEGAGQHWFTFSLAGSGPALIKIGAIITGLNVKQNNAAVTKKATQKIPDDMRQSEADISTPRLPANAELDYTGNNWKCRRGYRRNGNECVTVQIPSNAELDYTGSNWKCQRGYRRSGSGCIPVGV